MNRQTVMFLREDGTAVVESALSMMFFLLMLFGIMEAGRILEVQNMLTNAAREGARYAVLPMTLTSTLPSADEIKAKVRFYLAPGGIDASKAVILVNSNYQFPGDVRTLYTQVKVTLPYNVLTTSMFSSLKMTLTGQSIMRNEISP